MEATGQFVWFELMTRNVRAAQPFYEAVVGWRFASREAMDGETPYAVMQRVTDPSSAIGGCMEMREPDFPAGIPSHFIGYIAVEDADATCKKAVQLGGSIIHGPAEIPIGRFAIVSDTEGNIFSILQQPPERTFTKETPELYDVAWVELAAKDQKEAFTFYRDLFGWVISEERDTDGNMPYSIMSCPGSSSEVNNGFGGTYSRPDGMPGPAGWWYFFAVPDIEASVKAIADNGGTVYMGPMEVPGGIQVAWAADPEGAAFALATIAEVD